MLPSRTLSKVVLWLSLGGSLLLLFHFESVPVGPLKISHLWKGVLLGFLIIKVFSKGTFKSSVYNPLLLLALTGLFTLEIFYNPLNAIFVFSTTLIIPLIGIYLLDKEAAWCRGALFFISCFFVLCFIPYEIGLLESLGRQVDLAASYGYEVQRGVGPFQTAHSASTALAGALLTILFLFFASKYSRAWLVTILIVGFYLLLNTFVRTGMAMFALGSIIFFGFLFFRRQKLFLRVLLIAIVMLPLANLWIFSNDALMAKILGERIHSSEFASFENIGSGRGRLALATLSIYSEASLIEKIIGMGMTEQMLRMKDKIGIPLIPHNGFLEILTHNGLLGAFLFLWFLASFFKSIRKINNPISRYFLLSLFWSYLVMTFFQSYDMLYMLVILMLAYAFSKKTSSFDREVRHL